MPGKVLVSGMTPLYIALEYLMLFRTGINCHSSHRNSLSEVFKPPCVALRTLIMHTIFRTWSSFYLCEMTIIFLIMLEDALVTYVLPYTTYVYRYLEAKLQTLLFRNEDWACSLGGPKKFFFQVGWWEGVSFSTCEGMEVKQECLIP